MKPLFERKVSTQGNARFVEIHLKKFGDALLSGTSLLASLNQRLELAPVGTLLDIDNVKILGVLVDSGKHE
ncbi:hypothetical protein ACR3FX_001069 [Yersinia enterocolitica]